MIVPRGLIGTVYGAAMYVTLGAAVYLFAVSAPKIFVILMIPVVIVVAQLIYMTAVDMWKTWIRKEAY